jgi:predicted alpha/beta hydrolase family esterase
MSLHRDHLDMQTLEQTLGCVLKVHEDHGVANAHAEELAKILGEAPASLEAGGHSLQTDFGFGSAFVPRR